MRTLASTIKKNPVGFILLFYLVCFIFRAIEYLALRTDPSAQGEAFVHKLIGIGLLAVALWLVGYKWSNIGFGTKRAGKGLLLGLLFGGAVYAVAYGAEIFMLTSAGNTSTFQFYASSYSASGT